METPELLIRLVSGLMLLLLNGMFVTVEFALTRLRQFDREELGDGWGISLAWDMTGELEIYLTACQLGITITSILLGVTFEPGVTELIFPLTEMLGLGPTNTSFVSITLAVVLIQFMHTVWGEQSPTYLGVERPRQVAGLVAPILYGWAWGIYPVIMLGDSMAKWTLSLFGIELTRSWTEDTETVESQSDLRRQMGELLSKGELSDERRQEVINALEIDEIDTREIMVPRDEVCVIDLNRTIDTNLELVSDRAFSRLPLVDGTLDDCRGTIYVPGIVSRIDDLKAGKVTWDELAFEPIIVQADLPVSQLFDRFQDEDQELALVVDKDDRVVGLVTSTDATEAIIGDLEDPYD